MALSWTELRRRNVVRGAATHSEVCLISDVDKKLDIIHALKNHD
jgi:hypothetical protein